MSCGLPRDTENILVYAGKILPVTTLLKSAFLVSIYYVIKQHYWLSHTLCMCAHCCSNCSDFLSRHRALVTRLLSQGYKVNGLSNSFKKFYGPGGVMPYMCHTEAADQGILFGLRSETGCLFPSLTLKQGAKFVRSLRARVAIHSTAWHPPVGFNLFVFFSKTTCCV